MPTTDIGYAKNKQHKVGGKRRRHSVAKDENGRWITLCTNKPATREYRGWTNTVTCQACRKILEEEA